MDVDKHSCSCIYGTVPETRLSGVCSRQRAPSSLMAAEYVLYIYPERNSPLAHFLSTVALLFPRLLFECPKAFLVAEFAKVGVPPSPFLYRIAIQPKLERAFLLQPAHYVLTDRKAIDYLNTAPSVAEGLEYLPPSATPPSSRLSHLGSAILLSHLTLLPPQILLTIHPLHDELADRNF